MGFHGCSRQKIERLTRHGYTFNNLLNLNCLRRTRGSDRGLYFSDNNRVTGVILGCDQAGGCSTLCYDICKPGTS